MKRLFSITVILLTFVASMQAYDWDIQKNIKQAEKGKEEACQYLAICYLYGDQVEQDYEKALYYARKSSNDHVARWVEAVIRGVDVFSQDAISAGHFQNWISSYFIKSNIYFTEYKELSKLETMRTHRTEILNQKLADAIRNLLEAASYGMPIADVMVADYALKPGKYYHEWVLTHLTELAENGHEGALNKLVKIYTEGKSGGWTVDKNPAMALHLVKSAADKGSVGAMVIASQMYVDGKGTDKNVDEAYNLLKRAETMATGKHLADVKEKLKDFDDDGSYVPGIGRYTGEVREFYRRAMADDAEATYNLAVCFREGKGVARNEASARQLLRRASAMGSQRAENDLQELERADQARRETEQRERAQNPEKYDKPKFYVAKWRAINNDDLHMMLQIASIYERGDNSAMYEGIEGEPIDKNLDSALVMYHRRLDATIRKRGNSGDNASYIVNLYMKMGKKDKAISTMKELADKGNAGPSVILDLGYCYYHGYNVQQNYSLALKYLRQAAQQETDGSVANAANAIVGLMYFYGRGVAKNPAEAFKCWHGDPTDEYNGYYRMNALSTSNITRSLLPTTDFDKEYGFLTPTECEATMNDKAQCFHAYGVCYEKGYGTTPQLEYAAKMWLKGTAESSYKLGYYFENRRLGANLWPSERLQTAREYYRKAAQHGHQQAQAALRRLGN